MTESKDQLRRELERLEAELEYQVSHKRIVYIQERIEEIERELKKNELYPE